MSNKENQENQVPTIQGFLEFCKSQGDRPIKHFTVHTDATVEYVKTLEGWPHLDKHPGLMSSLNGDVFVTYASLAKLLEQSINKQGV